MAILIYLLMLITGVAIATTITRMFHKHRTSEKYFEKKLKNLSLKTSALAKLSKDEKAMDYNSIVWGVVSHPNSTTEIMYEALSNFPALFYSVTFSSGGFRIDSRKALEIIKYAGERKDSTSEGYLIYNYFVSKHHPTKDIVDYIMRQSLEDITTLITNPQLTPYAEQRIVERGDPSLLLLLLLSEGRRGVRCSQGTLLKALLSPRSDISGLAYQKATERGMWKEIYETCTEETLTPNLPDGWARKLAEAAYDNLRQGRTYEELLPGPV